MDYDIEIYRSGDEEDEHGYFIKIGKEWYLDCASWEMNGQLEWISAKELRLTIKPNLSHTEAETITTFRDGTIESGCKIHRITHEEFLRATGIVLNKLYLYIVFGIVS